MFKAVCLVLSLFLFQIIKTCENDVKFQIKYDTSFEIPQTLRKISTTKPGSNPPPSPENPRTLAKKSCFEPKIIESSLNALVMQQLTADYTSTKRIISKKESFKK